MVRTTNLEGLVAERGAKSAICQKSRNSTRRLTSGVYFPSRWMFWAGPIPVPLKQAAIWGIALIGFVGLGDRLARRDWRFAYVAAPLLVLMLPYVLGLPILRYRYPIGGLLAFLAADMVWRASKSVQKWLFFLGHPGPRPISGSRSTSSDLTSGICPNRRGHAEVDHALVALSRARAEKTAFQCAPVVDPRDSNWSDEYMGGKLIVLFGMASWALVFASVLALAFFLQL
jgi:hypothetical protein